MCILLTDKEIYKDDSLLVRNLLLNMKGSFTMEDVVKITKRYGVYNREMILNLITELCNYGLVYSSDNKFYSLMHSNISSRG